MKPKRLSRTAIYENPWVNLYVDKVQFPGGRIVDKHHVLEFDKEAVAAIVEDEQGRLLLVHAYRYVTNSIEWEIPAGGVEPGESVLETARREVWEETGYETVDHQLVYSFNPMNGMTNKVFHLVQCRATKMTGDFDTNEVQSFDWFSMDDILAMIKDKSMKDGYSLTGLLLYLQMLR